MDDLNTNPMQHLWIENSQGIYYKKGGNMQDYFTYPKTLIRQVTCLILGLMLTSGVAFGKFYKWRDEHGNVHFTDKIPPSAAGRGRSVLNDKGVTTKVIKRAKTPEEWRIAREQERLRAIKERLIAEQQAQDRVLLRTFQSEDDILMAKRGRIDAVATQIKFAQGNIRRYQAKLTGQQLKQAARMERSAKVVPEALRMEIKDTLKRVSDTYAIIRQKEQEQQAISIAFDRDVKRFRLLRHLNKDQQSVVDDGGPPVLENLLPCGEGIACTKAWGRAEAFVLKYATTPVQIQGDFIIMAKAPRKGSDISITMSRIRHKEQPTVLYMDLFCKNSPIGNETCASPKVAKIRRAYRAEVGGIAP